VSEGRLPPVSYATWPGQPAPVVDDDACCALCGLTRYERREDGCVRGACSTLPPPSRFYAPKRVCREYQRMVLDTGVVHSFYSLPEAAPESA
jgi:hypothetical protein